MNVGSKKGSRGQDVARLHRVLASIGVEVERTETEHQLFGESTQRALHALQGQRGLAVTDEIDSATLDVLLELEQNVTINVNEAIATTSPKPNTHDGRVTGTLVDGDGVPLPDTRVALFAKQLRFETSLGDARTNSKGAYAITYRRGA